MKDVEAALAASLADHAGRVAPWPGRREQTLRRMQRRRLRNALLAGAASVVVVTSGVAGVGRLTEDRRVRPAAETSGTTAATAGPYGFSSTTSAKYPYVATGWFRGAEWGLRAAAIRLAPGADVRVTLQITGAARGLTTSAYVKDYGDPLFAKYEYGSYMFRSEVAIVFGAADPAAETVEVSLENGDSVEAHVFTGHDARTTLDADYYLAYLPADASGEVIARDADGNVIAREVIPPR